MSNRKHVRAPFHLAVSYRTSGAFLVAYSVNLSKGGIFIETDPLPVGTEVHVALDVPQIGKLEVDGTVAWIREANSAGLPLGMGIQFNRGLDVEHGRAIDELVSSFAGLEILIVGSADRRNLLGRYVGSILSCETVGAETRATAEVALRDRVDLVIVDLDSVGADGMEVVKAARNIVTPVIVLATEVEAQQWARDQGVDQVVRNATFTELQQAVLAALSRATSTPEPSRDDTPTS